ncbi:MAG: T9SS type B sorting domain-containing protein [Mucilaginibacter sp.]
MAIVSYISSQLSFSVQKSICSRKASRLLLVILGLLLPAMLLAEGSKEITANGGYRAFLFSSNSGNSSFPFPTLGTMKVYVKAGETLNIGSSAQGVGSGTINLRAPDGSTYTSGSSTAIGLISNRTQEVAGPLPNAGGYTPYAITVQTGQTGVWEIDFVSPNINDANNPDPVPANATWTQTNGTYVCAFDITVRNSSTQALSGRVFTNVFSGILGAFNIGFNGIFYILTNDGYQYVMNNNGQAGNGFTFFANNKGFRTATGAAAYHSINNVNNPNVQDPRAADSQTDITHKIFFNTPASDLPASANTPGGGTTWLLTAPAAPIVGNVTFIGEEGTVGKAGTNPLGGNFTFTTNTGGNYSIVIDVNKNGVYTDAIDRKLTGAFGTGTNQVHWDGLDGQGNKVSGGNSAAYASNVIINITAGEVHFPFFDVERNTNGIILTRTNGTNAPDDSVYWDDSPITTVGTPSNPIKNITGISSTINGHKWGTATVDAGNDADFGNNKSIDTWSYITTAPVTSTVNFQLQEADLAILSLVANAGCAGQPISYTVAVKNNGPNDVTGAIFQFSFPTAITNVAVSSVATSGTSTVATGTISATAYQTNLDLANGAVCTFTITGLVSANTNGNVNVSASILRTVDFTDPDATNPDAAPPTDPVNECNAAPSGTGCNNIMTNTTVFSAAPYAGPDQTVSQYVPVTLTANSSGTWTQLATDPVAAGIANPTGSTTNITGLNTLGVYHFIFTNAGGCTATVALTVIRADTNIPNIFTPNNDGLNDVFKIKGLESYPGSQLTIFNRWGNEVYRADNYLNNWDGGNLAEGTYYYILNRKEHSGAITPLKGWVFIKRKK